MTVRIGITGCQGRMGQAITLAVLAADGLELAGGTEIGPEGTRMRHPRSGADLGVPLFQDTADLANVSDVLIDFTVLPALAHHLDVAADTGTAIVIGTTGLSSADHKLIDVAAGKTAVLQAGNMSLGVNVLTALVEKAAGILDDSWDIEVVEMHHRHKVDAPSGTAVMLGEAAAAGRDVELDEVACRARDGIVGARPKGEIGFATLRGGGVVGDHSVVLASENERLELGHRAEGRDLFADGAVRAAKWLAWREPGRYDMKDVLGLNDL